MEFVLLFLRRLAKLKLASSDDPPDDSRFRGFTAYSDSLAKFLFFKIVSALNNVFHDPISAGERNRELRYIRVHLHTIFCFTWFNRAMERRRNGPD